MMVLYTSVMQHLMLTHLSADLLGHIESLVWHQGSGLNCRSLHPRTPDCYTHLHSNAKRQQLGQLSKQDLIAHT